MRTKPGPRSGYVRLFALFGIWLSLSAAGYPAADDAGIAKKIDELAALTFAPGDPGGVVMVARDGKAIFRKAYGMADLELGVPMSPDMVLRLGSVTKQFTGVGILLLAQEGKLALSDSITRHLPDFPTHGKTITIAHLLGHTSGVVNYTDIPEWPPLWRKDMTTDEIVGLFKEKPPVFDPGARWQYSNSGYILLGAVIEKVAGIPYADFVQKRLLDPLGMTSSRYDVTARVIPRRVPGYQKGADGYENAPFLSMTQPQAAGGLITTVDDLLRWNEGLMAGKLLQPEWLKLAFTPFALSDGRSTRYACGWSIGEYDGHPTIEHGGGIHGFSSYVLSLPRDRVYVAVLTNTGSGEHNPGPLAFKAACLAVGRPYVDPVPAKVPSAAIDLIAGVYQGPDYERHITREGEKVFSRRSGGGQYDIFPVSETEFFFKDSTKRLVFEKDGSGKVVRVRLTDRTGPDEVAMRTDKPLPKARQAVTLTAEALARFAGVYELMPGFTLTVRLVGSSLMTQATGQPEIEIFPESATRFFLKVVDAQIDFQADASGAVTGLILHQGGQDVPGKKIK